MDPSHLARTADGRLEGYEIFIKYLPTSTTENDLIDLFKHVPDLVGQPRILKNHLAQCKGVAWITFQTQKAYQIAMQMDKTHFKGRTLQITPAKQAHTGFRPSLQAAGTHTPAMLNECVEQLVKPDTNGIIVDATYGRGGHSRGMLAALSKKGVLHGFDMDADAIQSAKQLAASDSRFHIHHTPFSRMEQSLGSHGPVSGVFFDLGISSPQFDEAHRGFRLEADGPLDLRFDQSRGETAYEYLLRADRDELINILSEGGETSDGTAARRIADAIILSRDCGKLPQRTREFAALVAAAKGVEYQAMHPAKLTFQALRIFLNDEFGELKRGLRAAFGLLREGGRIGVITWKHSECSLLIDVFRSLEAVRDDMPQLAYLRKRDFDWDGLESSWALEMMHTIRPSANELACNSRSRSAVLHIMRKVRKPKIVELERKLYSALGWLSPHVESETEGACDYKYAKEEDGGNSDKRKRGEDPQGEKKKKKKKKEKKKDTKTCT